MSQRNFTGNQWQKVPAEERFWAKVDKSGDCWEWLGSTTYGYGQFGIGRKHVYAHRWSYEQHIGPIPEGMLVDHVCHNSKCVRPDHLRVATHAQNLQYRKGATSHNKASGIRGVYRSRDRWHVKIQVDGKRHSFGSYATKEEAEMVAIRERNRLYEFADVDSHKLARTALIEAGEPS